MSFLRALVTSCRELLTLAPRTPFGAGEAGGAEREFGRPRKLAVTGLIAAACAVGLWALWTASNSRDMWHMLDLSVYNEAAKALDLPGGEADLYRENYGGWKLPFIYPPFAAYIFKLLAPLGFAGLKWFMAVSSLAALVSIVWCSWGMLGYRRSLGRVGATAVVLAAVLWLEPVQWTLVWGQINLVLLALVMIDVSLPDSRRYKGVLIGIAAGFKLTPALFIVYLLITRRFRAAGTATAAFAGTIALGWIAIPQASTAYWPNVVEISGRVNSELNVGTLNNQSIQGLFSRLTDNEGAVTLLWLAACAVVGLLGMIAAAKASLRGRELLGVVIVGALSLFVSPISWSHHWVWVVPAFVLIANEAYVRRTRLLIALTAAYWVFYAAWPLRLGGDGAWDGRMTLQPWGLIWLSPRTVRDGTAVESHWNFGQFLIGNSYLFAGIALTLAVSWAVIRTPDSSGEVTEGRLSTASKSLT